MQKHPKPSAAKRERHERLASILHYVFDSIRLPGQSEKSKPSFKKLLLVLLPHFQHSESQEGRFAGDLHTLREEVGASHHDWTQGDRCSIFSPFFGFRHKFLQHQEVVTLALAEVGNMDWLSKLGGRTDDGTLRFRHRSLLVSLKFCLETDLNDEKVKEIKWKLYEATSKYNKFESDDGGMRYLPPPVSPIIPRHTATCDLSVSVVKRKEVLFEEKHKELRRKIKEQVLLRKRLESAVDKRDVKVQRRLVKAWEKLKKLREVVKCEAGKFFHDVSLILKSIRFRRSHCGGGGEEWSGEAEKLKNLEKIVMGVCEEARKIQEEQERLIQAEKLSCVKSPHGKKELSAYIEKKKKPLMKTTRERKKQRSLPRGKPRKH